MPQLSPLNWIFIPLIIWVSIFLALSIFWWSTNLQFSKFDIMKSNKKKFSWNW